MSILRLVTRHACEHVRMTHLRLADMTVRVVFDIKQDDQVAPPGRERLRQKALLDSDHHEFVT